MDINGNPEGIDFTPFLGEACTMIKKLANVIILSSKAINILTLLEKAGKSVDDLEPEVINAMDGVLAFFNNGVFNDIEINLKNMILKVKDLNTDNMYINSIKAKKIIEETNKYIQMTQEAYDDIYENIRM